MMIPSYYGIKFVWDDWRGDTLRNQRITLNSNNPVYTKYYIPQDSKMLVYVLGNIQQLQGIYEVTGTYSSSGDPHFNIELPVNLIIDKINGLTITEIRKYLPRFNPSQQGISYMPISKSVFEKLCNNLKNKK